MKVSLHVSNTYINYYTFDAKLKKNRPIKLPSPENPAKVPACEDIDEGKLVKFANKNAPRRNLPRKRSAYKELN